jgi:hypothetical protein
MIGQIRARKCNKMPSSSKARRGDLRLVRASPYRPAVVTGRT